MFTKTQPLYQVFGKITTLSEAEKIINFEIARVRIKLEYTIGGLKRYYILRYEHRLNSPDTNLILDLALDCCAELCNFRREFNKQIERV